MKHSLILAALLALAGCQNLGYSNMTAEQIKATNGTSTCTQYTGLYGKASMIALNEQDVKKHTNTKGKVTINCGDAAMTIETDNSYVLPAAKAASAP